MFGCLQPPIDNDRSLSLAECSGLQPKVIICIERLLMVKDTQNNLYQFIMSFSKKVHLSYCEKQAPLAKENHCMARWHLNGFLSHEMFSSLYDQKTRFTPIDFHCNLK